MRRPLGRNNLPKRLLHMGRHLVYAEGTKTEPNYVESVKQELAKANGITPDDVEIVCFKTTKTKHTLELIERAEIDVASRMKRGETVHAVWIFFDKDSFDDFDEECRRIENKHVEGHYNHHNQPADENDVAWIPCYSNECFEIWVYLHFEDLHSALSRKAYIPKINSFIQARGHHKSYSKSEQNLFQFLQECGGDIEKAIRYAKRKVENLKPDEPKPNPSTGVYLFAEFFLAYIKNEPK